MLNIELKARHDNLIGLRESCKALGAEAQDPDRQIDTYFKIARGRLKLRESLLSGAELIYYIRADVAGARESHYETCPVGEPERLKAVLGKALEVWAIVAKRREIFEIGSVRIHLDKVQGLGSFVELEGMVDDAARLGEIAEEVRALQRALGIDDPSLVKESYSDLIPLVGGGPASGAR
jgi:adenylate cyclase